MRKLLIALALIAFATGPAVYAADDDDDDAPVAAASATPGRVEMDEVTQKRLGVTTSRLVAARQAGGGVSGSATVLDPMSLVEIDGEIAQAQIALSASQAQANRARALNQDGNAVSTKEAEAASALARADQAKLTLLKRRLGLEWGPAIAALTDERRGQLVDDLATGRAALVRVDSLGGAARASGTLSINFTGVGAVQAVVLGPARTAEANLRSPGDLARVSGAAAVRLSTGLTGRAQLGGGTAVSGVVIPRSALVRRGGQTFAYVKVGDDDFERRAINGGVFRIDGLFAPGGFSPGDQIVLTGGGALLGAEFGAVAGDDD